jgi:hypothetical protein
MTLVIAQSTNHAIPHYAIICNYYFVYNIQTYSKSLFLHTYYIAIVSDLCILSGEEDNTKKNV